MCVSFFFAQRLAEIPYKGRQLPFQVSWCPKNPYFIGVASYEDVFIETIIGAGVTEALAFSPKVSFNRFPFL